MPGRRGCILWASRLLTNKKASPADQQGNPTSFPFLLISVLGVAIGSVVLIVSAVAGGFGGVVCNPFAIEHMFDCWYR